MIKKIIAGIGGAIALNILHETLRKNFNNVPHINEVGEEALLKVTDESSIDLETKDHLYVTTLVADIVSNGMYYATTTTNHNITSGLLAGIGAIALPKPLGLNEKPVAGTNKKKLMTVGYYLFGAVVTKCIYDKIK